MFADALGTAAASEVPKAELDCGATERHVAGEESARVAKETAEGGSGMDNAALLHLAGQRQKWAMAEVAEAAGPTSAAAGRDTRKGLVAVAFLQGGQDLNVDA